MITDAPSGEYFSFQVMRMDKTLQFKINHCFVATQRRVKPSGRRPSKNAFVCSGEKDAPVSGKLIEMGRFSEFDRYSGEYVKLALAGVSPMISPT